MELNYNIQNEKTMEESITELYENINKILTIHCKLNKMAMNSCHSLGYNGFKRWHRYRSIEFFELKICLANELFDKFRIKSNFKEYELNYSPNSIEEHLKSWDKALLDAIQELGNLNKKYYEETGMNCKIIECSLHKMIKDYEKVGRYLKRFNESDWLTLDMHIVDDKIHEHYKCKEEKYGYKY